MTPTHSGNFEYRSSRSVLCALLPAFVIFVLSQPAECAELFSVQCIAVSGKILSVIPVDINSESNAEIIVLSKTGHFPREKRWISLFRADKSGHYSNTARQRWEVDRAASMIEVGDVAPSRGKEIFYLTNTGISYYPQVDDGLFSKKPRPLISFPTIAVSPIVGYLPRSHLLGDWKGNNREILLIPQFNALVFFDRDDDGAWRHTDSVTVTPRTFLFSGNEDDGAFRDYSIHTEFRLPRIFQGDFNGDRLLDLLLTEQESLTVFLQSREGKFSPEPSYENVFPVRPSGKEADVNLFFLTTPVDLNGDNFIDVILTLSKGTGKFLEQEIIIFIFMNNQSDESPFSTEPDQIIAIDGATPGVNIVDVNGDGQTDLLFSKIKLGFWRIVQNLLSKRVKLDTSIYLLANNDRYPKKPSFLLKSDYEIDLTHRIRFRGTWPTIGSDFNKDGFADLLVARDGKIEVFLNTLNNDLYTKPLSQSDVMTSPFMQTSDLNGDGLKDLIFYEKKRNGSISLLLNKGNWEEAKDSGDDRQRHGAN